MDNLRKSSYLIAIPLGEQKEKYMFIQGYTGAIDIVNSSLKEYLVNQPKINKDSFPYSKQILDKLIERGYITSKSINEEREYIKKISRIFHNRDKQYIKSFTLLVTYNCNFKCPYCFEKEELKKGNNDFSWVINKEMVDNFFNVISVIEPNENLRNKTINLFGGEPLLEKNEKIIEYIIRRGSIDGYSFTATSNGYDMDHYERLIKEKLIQGIQITIDGTKLIHNSRRIHIINGDSFDKIIKNIKMALNYGIHISIRINVDKDNANEIVKLNSFFKETGFYSYKNFSAYAVYISGELNFNPNNYNESTGYGLSQKDFLNILESSKIEITHNQQLYYRLYDAISKNKAISLSPCHCSAQSSSYVFDPFGYIYSCPEIVGEKNKSIGTYYNGLVWTKEKEKWFSRDISIIEKCSKCKYALICGGGCFTKAQLNNKNSDSYCDAFPIVLKAIANKIYSHNVVRIK